MDAVTQVPTPVNEPVHGYAPGSPERGRLEAKLKELADNPVDLPCTIGGEKRMGGGERFDVVQPHNHKARLGTYANATQQDAQDAIDAALAAAPAWRAMSFDDRAAIILRAAELLSGPWRETIAASTMLGQSKTAQQAEIDSPCELIDFWRFNVHYARNILAEQPPANSPGVWNRMDHRPLEGFVYAITPFNFSAIAANLPTAPALMGNVVVWKPSPTQTHAAVLLMRLLEEAGLPKGVINLVTGDGIEVSKVALEHRDLAGIHARKKLTLVHKNNVLTFAGHLWTNVFNKVAEEYPEVTTDYIHVDAATIYLVTQPERFDVIVTDNLFGDIITDLAAAVSGGIGVAASGNINPSGTFPSMFEPVHGSAPDIAGQGKADPSATVLSVALLLRHLGHEAEAARIEDAVSADLAERVGLPARSTSEIGDALAVRVAG
ncbi:3-isopropylmalate dehydrogenase [Streptomyces hirsutus]